MTPETENISVMLIDDDELLLSSMLGFLEDVGFKATGFSSADEALQSIRLSPPDVCIVDLRMPDIDGEQFISALMSTSPTVRCIIYTGSWYLVSEELIALGLKQEDVVRKPVEDFDKFIEKIIGHS